MDSLELLFDRRAEAVIRADWRRLIDAGLPSAGRNPGPTNRPHLTVLAAPDLSPAACGPLDERVAAAAEDLDLVLDCAGFLLFGPTRGKFILSRQVVVTSALLELQRRVHDAAQPVLQQARDTLPGHWTPHVTLARRLSAEQVALAVGLLGTGTLSGTASGLRRWDSSAGNVHQLAEAGERRSEPAPGG